jgi:hypothetical protein
MAFGGNLTLEIHPGEAPSGWDDDLLAGGGVVFHSAAWAAHKTGGGEGDPLFCLWRQGAGGEVIARGLGIRRPGEGSRAARIAAKIGFDSPPTALTAADFVSPLAAWARQSPAVIEVGLGSFDAIGGWQAASLPRPRARCEYVIPPGGGEEDLWSGMRQLARRKVKRAEKSEFEGREARLPEELREFAAVYRTTEERLSRTKDYVPDANLDSERFAESLAQLTERGCGRLYGVFSAQGLEAGTVFATFGKRAYMIYSAATDRGREAGAPFLAMFAALRDLRAAGYEHLNLGGAGGDAADPESADHGLHQFKTRFGAEVEPRTSGSLPVRPLRAKLIAGSRRLVRR